MSVTSSKLTLGGILWRVALVVILLMTFFPFIFMVITSFKNNYQFYHNFWLPEFPLELDNYKKGFGELKGYLFNSLFITATSILGIVVFSTTAGFVFARYKFPLREFLYYLLISMMMIPATLMLIPSFVWVDQLGLIDTYWVMILPYVAGGQIMGIYLLRSFFEQIDNGLFEAAQVDGAGTLRQLWHVAIPLAKPIVGVVVIVSALAVWNNFIWPLVTTSSEDVMVLTVGMLRYMGRHANVYGRTFAGYTISAIPLGIMFMFCTRLFMKGITSGALKA